VKPITKEDRDRAKEMKEIYLVLKFKQEQGLEQLPYNADGEPLSLMRDVLEFREEESRRKASPFHKRESTMSNRSPLVE
jgi:hypothetical protein